MSFEITAAFVQQYSSAVMHLVQQRGSRLRQAVRLETGIVGKTAFFDQIGVVGGSTRVLERHGDSPLNPTPHARRRVSMFDHDTGDLVDDFDMLKTLIDPANAYVEAHANRLGRGIDDEIITAFYGTNFVDETGSTAVAFPAAQQVAVNDHTYDVGTGNAPLTISKLISAKVLLDAAENDPNEERYIACAAKDIGNLLTSTEVGSRDYNDAQALVKGTVREFMGFKFIRTERLPVDGSGFRRVMCWRKSAVLLAIGKDISARIAPRPDKKFVNYAYLSMSVGATRMEEPGCVEIKVTP